jgi:hypothetical protein
VFRKYRYRRLLAGVILLLYVSSYIALSRRAYAEADRWGMKGFYYLTLEDSFRWRYGNTCCVFIFAPCSSVDRLLGFGRVPSVNEPLWGLNR